MSHVQASPSANPLQFLSTASRNNTKKLKGPSGFQLSCSQFAHQTYMYCWWKVPDSIAFYRRVRGRTRRDVRLLMEKANPMDGMAAAKIVWEARRDG
jgi:hypothetical protein